jgi:hypothetical protein
LFKTPLFEIKSSELGVLSEFELFRTEKTRNYMAFLTRHRAPPALAGCGAGGGPRGGRPWANGSTSSASGPQQRL